MTSPSEKRGKHLKTLEKEKEKEVAPAAEKKVVPVPEKKVIRSTPKPITKKKTV